MPVSNTEAIGDAYTYHVTFICPKCSGPILVKVRTLEPKSLESTYGDIRELKGTHIHWVEPRPNNPEAPLHTPARVAEYYTEACDSLHRQKWTSAASMLRKCLEVALKEFAPEVEAWKLEKRIDKLADEHRITPALQDWAHELRLDGNEALHDIEPASEELATRMERLTYFLLLYLYTLPKQVESARAARENGSD